MIDPHGIEYWLVRLRNRISLRLARKGDREHPRVFIMGHPHTATTVLARLFEANGYNSQHTSRRWRTDAHECFADRGNYQPLDLLRATYPNSMFILNTRPSLHYVRNRLDRQVRKRLRKGRNRPRFSERFIRGEILRHNAFLLEFAEASRGRDDFLVFNIESPGGFQFMADWMGLEGAPEARPYSGGRYLSDEESSLIDQAYESLGVAGERLNPFVIPDLVPPESRKNLAAFLEEHRDRIRL
ncbi:hypothetical protein CK501_03755 [Halovibrio salipaludis]|uniref:Sulfotransferase family protein n=1 Tax=Halovibrio salipaludis TaxID=2032626 RepID=A0A2A2F9T9_9GAMM|nr:hypothetical protein [Halovibrio salipaludis]PAU82271.1 hypothetical protein CK501_03755 [Halovibrio salipaludis]